MIFIQASAPHRQLRPQRMRQKLRLDSTPKAAHAMSSRAVVEHHFILVSSHCFFCQDGHVMCSRPCFGSQTIWFHGHSASPPMQTAGINLLTVPRGPSISAMLSKPTIKVLTLADGGNYSTRGLPAPISDNKGGMVEADEALTTHWDQPNCMVGSCVLDKVT